MTPILTKRPEGMSMEAYIEIRKREKAALKAYKKGTIVKLKTYKRK